MEFLSALPSGAKVGIACTAYLLAIAAIYGGAIWYFRSAPDSKKPEPEKPKPDFEGKCEDFGSVNGIPCYKKEVSPGVFTLIVNEEARQKNEQRNKAEQAKKNHLMCAMVTRLVTGEEMLEIMKYGEMLNITPGVSYEPIKKTLELQHLYCMQALIQSHRINIIRPAGECFTTETVKQEPQE